MLRVVDDNERLYKIKVYGWGQSRFVIAKTERDLFEYIASLESEGATITSVCKILLNGNTPRVAFRQSSIYKEIKKQMK